MFKHSGQVAVLLAFWAADATLGQGSGVGFVWSDQTIDAGLTSAVHSAGEGDFEIHQLSGGGAAGDFNNDGWQDIFFLGGIGGVDRLFMNNGDGTFTDQAAAWGIAFSHWGFGAAVGDYNADGWLDLYVTSGGSQALPGRHMLYRNNGDHTFSDVAAEAGVQWTAIELYDGMGAGFGDYDLDGDLDLAVAGWMGQSQGNRLFRNNGNGAFTDVTLTAIRSNLSPVRGFSPRFHDMNGDRYPELLWVADFQTSRYFMNNRNGTFSRAPASSGVGLDANGMGTTVGDLNNDGLPDWYVTSIFHTQGAHPTVPGTGNMLYMNLGAHRFQESGAAAGVRQGGWGWGTVAADFDLNGLLDIAETNGWRNDVFGGIFDQDPSCLFVHVSSGLFVEAAAATQFNHSGQGRCLVNLDYDNDGDQDLALFSNNGPLTLYRNDQLGPVRHWLRVFVDTSPAPWLAPNGYGTKVAVAFSGGAGSGGVRRGWISGGPTYLGQGELSVHFGLGDQTTIDALTLEWASGRTTVLTGVSMDQTLVVRYCPCDWNGVDGLDSQDFFDFLSEFFDGSANFNNNSVTDSQDFFEFLECFLESCE